MLDYLRRKAQSPALQVTIVVIILVFIFWGTNMGDSNRRDAVAMVNDHPISFTEFNQEYNRSMDQLREQFGGALPKGLLQNLGMKNQILQRLIQRTLMLQGGQELGLYVSKWEVQKLVQSQQAFQVNGVFDNERYIQLLASNRLNPKTYEADLRQDILARKVTRELAGFATLSDWEANDRYAFDNEELQLEYAIFSADQFTAQVEVKDDELAAWYSTNKQQYQTEPQVKLDYLTYDRADYLAAITIGDQEAQKYYELNKAKYQLPEQRHASHILLRKDEGGDQKTKLENILSKAKAGEDFAMLASQFSQDPGSASRGGDLGFFSRGRMVPVFEETVFSLQPGEISAVVESQFGFHIIKLLEIKPAALTPFIEVKENIIADLQTEQAKAVAFEKAGEAYEKIFQAGSLANYTNQQGITLQQSDFFKQSAPPTELAGNAALVNKAFTLAKGELSSLLETANGYAIIYINDRQEPVIPELGTVQERATSDFRAAKATEMAEKAATDTLQQIKDGSEFSAAVAAAGSERKITPFFSRKRLQASTLPQELASNAFSLHSNNVLPEAPLAQGSSFYVYAFLQKSQGDTSISGSTDKAFRTALAQEKQMALIDSWLTFLMKKSTITTNKKFMEQE